MSIAALRARADLVVAEAAASESAFARARLLAVGWATVELDRAERELTDALGDSLNGTSWRNGPRDALLGAVSRVAEPPAAGFIVVLLEPDTEGRLVASLVRHDEGVAVAYVRLDAAADGPEHELSLSREAGTPLGRGRLWLGGSRWGPSVVVVEPSATIGR